MLQREQHSAIHKQCFVNKRTNMGKAMHLYVQLLYVQLNLRSLNNHLRNQTHRALDLQQIGYITAIINHYTYVCLQIRKKTRK